MTSNRGVNRVHPSAVIEGDVSIGENSEIGALCYIRGPVDIGKNTQIGPHCIIGTDAEHKSRGSLGRIVIGSNTIIRELTVITRGTGDYETQVGDDCYIMDHCHIAHDCVIENGVTMSHNCTLGGHSMIHTRANVGIGSTLHQYSIIGAYAMVGMGSVITKDVPPLCLVYGNPAKFARFNTHVFKSLHIGPDDLELKDGIVHYNRRDLQTYYKHFKKFSKRQSVVEALLQQKSFDGSPQLGMEFES